MKNCATNTLDDQEKRLQVKTLNQQMKNLAIYGSGLSPWEADVLVDTIEDVYFTSQEIQIIRPGQMKYQCVASEEGAGKPLLKCKTIPVILTLHDDNDYGDFSSLVDKDISIEIRQRRLMRIADEAKSQGGLLSQEDLAKILMCDVRTIGRDIRELREREIIVPTRGQQKDIGPGVTHKGIAIRKWIEGKEPVEIARHIKHSVKAVEIYLHKFQRVVYLKRKNCSPIEIATIIGISLSSTESFLEIYNEHHKADFIKHRIEEIEVIGKKYHEPKDEKKTDLQKNTNVNWRSL